MTLHQVGKYPTPRLYPQGKIRREIEVRVRKKDDPRLAKHIGYNRLGDSARYKPKSTSEVLWALQIPTRIHLILDNTQESQMYQNDPKSKDAIPS